MSSDSLLKLCQRIQDQATARVDAVFGVGPDDDPRKAFLAELEFDRIYGHAEKNALTRLILEKLGVSKEDWIACLSEELSEEFSLTYGGNGNAEEENDADPK